MDKKLIGSSFDDFLSEEGLLEQTETMAIKRVLAYQVEELMKEQNLSKTEMSRRMRTSRASLERLLDPGNQSVTLQTLGRAARFRHKFASFSLTSTNQPAPAATSGWGKRMDNQTQPLPSFQVL